MKPPRFDYHLPTTLDEALRLRGELGGGASILAGGQSLVPMLNARLARPSALIDLNQVENLAYIRRNGNGIAVGGMTRQRDLERSPEAMTVCPLLRETLELVAHPIIRNRGTVGGSIAHADPAAELPAALLALGGRVTARSATAERTIPVEELFEFHFTTSLAPDEILTEVWFPDLPRHSGWAVLEVSRRHGDYALAGVACVIANGRVRLGFTGVGPTPILVESDDPEVAVAAARPADDIHGTAEYRRELVRVLTRRVLALARLRAEGRLE